MHTPLNDPLLCQYELRFLFVSLQRSFTTQLECCLITLQTLSSSEHGAAWTPRRLFVSKEEVDRTSATMAHVRVCLIIIILNEMVLFSCILCNEACGRIQDNSAASSRHFPRCIEPRYNDRWTKQRAELTIKSGSFQVSSTSLVEIFYINYNIKSDKYNENTKIYQTLELTDLFTGTPSLSIVRCYEGARSSDTFVLSSESSGM
jgi:hypothetical protein